MQYIGKLNKMQEMSKSYVTIRVEESELNSIV